MAGAEQLVIERDGNRVVLTMNHADAYEAIQTYEKLIAQVREGFVLLDVATPPLVVECVSDEVKAEALAERLIASAKAA